MCRSHRHNFQQALLLQALASLQSLPEWYCVNANRLNGQMKIPSKHPVGKVTNILFYSMLAELGFDFNPKFADDGQFVKVIEQCSPYTVLRKIFQLSLINAFEENILERYKT